LDSLVTKGLAAYLILLANELCSDGTG